MSVQAALGFIAKVGEDASLYETVKGLPAGDVGALCQAASAAGYAFGEDDWKAAVAESGALSDDDLDGVSGGTGPVVATQNLPKAQVVRPGVTQMPIALKPFAFGRGGLLGKSECKSCKACKK